MSIASIKPIFFATGADCLNAFYDGKVDLAFMGSVPFILGRSAGVPIRILALMNRSRGGEAVLASSSIGSTPAGNQELSVGTVFGSTSHYLLRRYQQYSPPGQRIYTLFMPPELQLDALGNGFIDAIAVWEPYVAYAVDRFNASIIYDDSNLPGGGLNLLVIREGFLAEYKEAVNNFMKVLQAGTGWIRSNKTQASTLLTNILSTPDMTSYDLNCSSLDRFEWSFLGYRQNLEDAGLQKELLDVSSFLAAEQIAPPLPLYPADIFAARDVEEKTRADQDLPAIRLGYSSDIMCAAFLVAGALNLWSRHGFQIPRRDQLVAERIIHYDQKTQKDLLKVFRQMREGDTKSEAISLRRMLERCLKSLCVRYGISVGGEHSQAGLFAYLDALGKAGVVPEDVQSYSHLVRLFGNEAAHEKVAHGPDLPILLEFTMRVFDWAYGDGSGHCPECNLAINVEWKFCAGCGALLQEEEEPEEEVRLPLNGREVMKLLKIDSGPLVGEALEYLHETIIADGELTREQAEALLRQWHQQQSASPARK